MCEMLGVLASEKMQVNDLLKKFFEHSTEHPHGWGLALFRGNGVSLEKEPEAAYKSEYLKQRLRFKIEADQMIAHIRLATKGNVDYENTHPFVEYDSTGRTWTLAHNGTIFECDAMNKYAMLQQGRTDSERILLYLVENINRAEADKGSPLSQRERFTIVDRVIGEITPENKVNLLIFDGELMYAHTNYENSLYTCKKGTGIAISTRPLDNDSWEPLPMNTPLAFKAGKLLFTGTDHGNTFIDSEEKMRLLFLDFASL